MSWWPPKAQPFPYVSFSLRFVLFFAGRVAFGMGSLRTLMFCASRVFIQQSTMGFNLI
ncbi:hypothetical protein SODALDRAFT_329386 [Sodiomyces alkalinus F11]|uniref:Uncharacterized protein n=1 Tax=Sodiomyces alkalinus (strain CBS 110278 / VKM F-3762 / F11) TaxID=1314773 RepID=A0A3N2PKZ2_SODAK|nr:hypothetical protein SODALDRAFT_329386 [Sodiomyces alkalinus F11]ROT35201.1 hypothetical protein SODALDRAFT_329386 [Sodiomyces alkalinus F11]